MLLCRRRRRRRFRIFDSQSECCDNFVIRQQSFGASNNSLKFDRKAIHVNFCTLISQINTNNTNNEENQWNVKISQLIGKFFKRSSSADKHKSKWNEFETHTP